MDIATTQAPTRTPDVIQAMLTENTGRHFLDSGGAYGRNWERNQGRQFEDEPAARGDFSAWRKPDDDGPGRLQVCATVSLYHWMKANLELDEELQGELDRFVEDEANSCWNWLQVADEFANHIHAMGRCGAEPGVINTYNDPDNVDLSQTLQYVKLFMDVDDSYEPTHLVVSVHGGCDVRGGYSAPKVFRLRQDYWQAYQAMGISGLYAGDNSWYRGGWDSFEENSFNDVKGSIVDLPAYRMEWLEEEVDDNGTRAAIERAEQDKFGLSSTSLSVQQQGGAKNAIDANVKELRSLLDDMCVQHAARMHEAFVITRDGRAWLLTQSSAAMADGEEIAPYVDF